MDTKGAAGHGGAAARGRGHAAAALDRRRELQSRLSDARHASAAQARRQARMAAYSGLLGGEGRDSRRSTSTTRLSSTSFPPRASKDDRPAASASFGYWNQHCILPPFPRKREPRAPALRRLPWFLPSCRAVRGKWSACRTGQRDSFSSSWPALCRTGRRMTTLNCPIHKAGQKHFPRTALRFRGEGSVPYPTFPVSAPA